MIKNKRGDIPVIFLVIGVFGVCTLALLTFFVADFKMANSFVGVSIVEKMNSVYDEYLWQKNIGRNDDQLGMLFNITEVDGVKYLYIEKTANRGTFFGLGEEYVEFSVRYPI